jgi:NAD(P)-dependent dehydrogenase (short-subunit alcohol dehydrogenase family)
MTQTENMQGKTCLITGANSGIGKATALGLAQAGAKLILVCRDQAKGAAVQSEIIAATGNKQVDVLLAELASQASIRQLAAEVIAKYDRLDVLINNAGVSPSQRVVTEDSLEATFAVNYMAPYLLTTLLLDKLKASAPARIVNVASSAVSPLDFNDLQSEKEYKALAVYARSKFADILFTFELARQLEGSGVTVNCVHPGVVSTQLARDYNVLFRLMARYFFTTPAKGAATSIYVATSPEVASSNGKYFAKSKQATPPKGTDDKEAARRLWQISETLLKQPSQVSS